MEKQLVLKTAGDLAKNFCRTTEEDVKDIFPLQDPNWNPNNEQKSIKNTQLSRMGSKGNGTSRPQDYKLVSFVRN